MPLRFVVTRMHQSLRSSRARFGSRPGGWHQSARLVSPGGNTRRCLPGGRLPWRFRPFPSDVFGVVEANADDVEGFAHRDEVFCMIRFPSFGESLAYAEFVSAPGPLRRPELTASNPLPVC